MITCRGRETERGQPNLGKIIVIKGLSERGCRMSGDHRNECYPAGEAMVIIIKRLSKS